jgi:hypothetical protein
MAPGVFICTTSAGASNRNVIPDDVLKITKNKIVAANLTASRLILPHLEALEKKLNSLVFQTRIKPRTNK